MQVTRNSSGQRLTIDFRTSGTIRLLLAWPMAFGISTTLKRLQRSSLCRCSTRKPALYARESDGGRCPVINRSGRRCLKSMDSRSISAGRGSRWKCSSRSAAMWRLWRPRWSMGRRLWNTETIPDSRSYRCMRIARNSLSLSECGRKSTATTSFPPGLQTPWMKRLLFIGRSPMLAAWMKSIWRSLRIPCASSALRLSMTRGQRLTPTR